MKITLTIKEKLYKDLKAYCNLNEIDIEQFCNDAISKELVSQKYGDIPFGVIGGEKKEELPKISMTIPKESKLVSEEIIPVQAMNPPTGEALVMCVDEITSTTKTENKQEENKEKPKNKKRRL